MNSLNKILPIVAVVAAITAAIVPAHKSAAQGETQYYWFDADGNYLNYHGSSSTAQSALSCSGNNTICAVGFSANQLQDQNNPDAGLGSGVTNVDAQSTLLKQ